MTAMPNGIFGVWRRGAAIVPVFFLAVLSAWAGGGASLRLVRKVGPDVYGNLIAVKGATLLIEVPSYPMIEVELKDVREVYKERSSAVLTGAIVGIAGGAVIGGVVGAASYDKVSESRKPGAVFWGAVLDPGGQAVVGIIGAAAGGLGGGLIGGVIGGGLKWKLMYRASGPSPADQEPILAKLRSMSAYPEYERTR